MKYKTQFAIAAGVLALLGIGGRAQENTGLQVQNVHATIVDRSGRSFNSGTLTTALAYAPGYDSGQTIGAESVEFTVGDGTKSYPIHDGGADLKLLVPADASKDPFKYQFIARESGGEPFLTRNVEVSGKTRTLSFVAPDKHAPLSSGEKVGGTIFSLVTVALIFATFFFMAFRRMLFNRRMEVSSATLWSNILTFLFVVIAACTIVAAFMTPELLTTSANTYLGLAAVFIGVYSLGIVFMLLATRPRLRGIRHGN